MDRNRYADLLRVIALAGVVYGHWLLTDITDSRGQLGGLDALGYVSWGRWGTLLFQVMPVFFLVGGYVNARSWTAHSGGDPPWTRRGPWARWVRHRAVRLLRPATVYVAVAVVVIAGARAAGASLATLAAAGWLVAFQLWFLPVYLLLIALTPALLAAHRRWGLTVPAAMAVAAAAVDAAVLGLHLPVVGFANYLLVWGAMHQWGFAWQDGRLTSPRWRPYALAACGALVLAGLLAWSPFPVDMIGDGEPVTNTTPPSIALLAFAAAQLGLVLAAEPAATRLLARPGPWRLVTRLNDRAMTVYLWHMAPVIVIAVAFYPTGVMPQPAIGTVRWWVLRLAWFALLTVVLVPVVAAFTWADRTRELRLPDGAGPDPSPASALVLLAGVLAVMVGLARLAIAGFAPAGQLPLAVLAVYAAGLAAVAAAPILVRPGGVRVRSGTGP
jgi:fucose 4-O-acetylase-like acetyltransferase